MRLLPSWLQIRKTIKVGPLHINLSKSGLGWTLGRKGVRVGRSARGRRTFSLSKDNVTYRKD